MPQEIRRLDDDEAHERALERLADVVGVNCLGDVCWDPDHHLQGHVDVAGRRLVVIASRDDGHVPLVLTESEWDAMRHGYPAVAATG